MGSVDKTLFTLNHSTDFLLVQIYVDDIIFGGSSHSCVTFSENDREEVSDVHHRRTNLFLRYPSQANEARYICTLLTFRMQLRKRMELSR
jgi:hypothetical protein